MEERRQDLRYRAVRLRASLVLDDGSQPLTVKDVSKSGICFLYKAALPRGETRRLRLMLELGPERFSEALELQMRVVWATALGADDVQIGAAFAELDARQQRLLDDVLYFLTRDVAEDENGRPAFRTGLVAAVDVGESESDAQS